jgi:ketosteroid isomerase-like protein
MSASIRASAIAILLTLACPAWAAQPNPAAQRILPASPSDAAVALEGFHAALRRGDAKAALAFVADDAIVFEEGRAERSKAEYALRHAEADAAFSKAVPSKLLSRIGHATADLALIASESRTKGRFNGQDVDRIMVESMVLRRQGGAWKIVHIHWSSAQPSTE